MKSKFKKLLATALVLCLVLALLPAAAFAAGYTVTMQNNAGEMPYNGSLTVNETTISRTGTQSVTVENGTPVKVAATPNSDAYGVLSIQPSDNVTDWNATSGTFTMPEGNVVFTVQFMPWRGITVDELGHGSIQTSVPKAMSTQTVTVTVTPDEGYEVERVYYKVGEKETDIVDGSFQMPDSDITIYAELKESTKYQIKCNQTIESNNGYVTAIPKTASANQKVTVITTAKEGYKATQITVFEDGETFTPIVINGDHGTFTMPAHDVTVVATFEEVTPTTDHSIITASNITGGTLDSNMAMASANETVTITATPYNGYKTVEVYYILSGQYGLKVQARYVGYNQWQFTMPDAAVEVYATFKYDPYYPVYDYHAINVTSDGHCTVDVKNWAYCGEYVTINLSNFDAGYAFSYLKVDGEYVTPYGFNGYLSYTFKMPHNNVAIEVGTTSVSGKYYIDTSYDSTLGGVEVWVNNNYVNNWHQGSWADYKDSVSFKVKPYYSDDVVSVSVVGKQTGWTYSYDYNSYSGWYTFSMPREDVTISVDFRSGVHKVYVDKVTDGKLTVSDDWAKYGQIVYITAVPDYGCTLSSLSVRTATGDSVHVYNAQKADTYYFYMPDQYVSVSAVFTGKYTSLPFNDVSYGDWYYDAVQFVYSKGIMDGVDYYKFAPNGTITRGMILTMLWRMAGEPFEMPVTSFTDVEIGRYYTTAVAWACRNGIADGMGESTFGPNDAITREELVTLLYRYAQYFGHSCIGTSIEGFADAGSVSSYAYNAMCWAYKAGVVTGTTGSRLNPQGTASRAEAAQMIMSFYSFLNS